MEPVDEIKTDIECDICNTKIVEIPNTGDIVWHWCPYCGNLFQGTRAEVCLYVSTCAIADKVNW